MDLLEISEIHIPEIGKMTLVDIEFLYSGRKDRVHRQGVGFMMNMEIAKSCLGWEFVNNPKTVFSHEYFMNNFDFHVR